MRATAKIITALALMISTSVTTIAQESASNNNDDAATAINENCKMKFNANGQFKILQLTDLHYMLGNEKTTRSAVAVEKLIAYEQPDLIVVTGDLIDPPVEESLQKILEPLEASGVPYAVTYGNHDGGVESRAQMAAVAGAAPHCLNQFFSKEKGGGNGVITLTSPKANKVCRVIYLLDSNGYAVNKKVGDFDHVSPENIAWYRNVSNAFTKANGGEPVPSFMFYHIPLPELKAAAKEGKICGTRTWNEVTPSFSNGLFLAAVEQGDVDAMFFGHDHGNDYSVMWHNILLAYGRYTGCKERIPGLAPQGARVIVLTEGTHQFKTYIRLMDGTVEQEPEAAE